MSFSRQIKVSNALISFIEKKIMECLKHTLISLQQVSKILNIFLWKQDDVLIHHFVKGRGPTVLKRFRFSNVHIFFLKPSQYSSKYLWKYGKGLMCLNLFNHFDEPKGVSRRLQVKGKVWVIHLSCLLGRFLWRLSWVVALRRSAVEVKGFWILVALL